MLPCQPPTENWNRAFTVWINGIHVSFQSQVVGPVVRGGLLRKVRIGSRVVSLVVMGLFSLHCTTARAADTTIRKSFIAESSPEYPKAPSFAKMPHLELGLASWYGDGDGFEELETASGEILDSRLATCAHRTLPFGTLVQIENLKTGAKALARVNDRGPFVRGRIIDVTARVARELGLQGKGVARVQIRTVSLDKNATSQSSEPLRSLDIRWAGSVDALSSLSLTARVSLALDSTNRRVRPVSSLELLHPRTLPDDGSRESGGRLHGRLPFLHREA